MQHVSELALLMGSMEVATLLRSLWFRCLYMYHRHHHVPRYVADEWSSLFAAHKTGT